jgi:hypothetical protein
MFTHRTIQSSSSCRGLTGGQPVEKGDGVGDRGGAWEVKGGRVPPETTARTPGRGGKTRSGVPLGNGRLHPRWLSSRLRFWPAAIGSASALNFGRPRSRKRYRPCHALASANSGSTPPAVCAWPSSTARGAVAAPSVEVGGILTAPELATPRVAGPVPIARAGVAGGGEATPPRGRRPHPPDIEGATVRG